ncbi:dihydroorotase [Algivirga pacifica]|uniref:Dihydroorotase n=1 Tax=Algivirga pacifica TaxID=1162670 RepID=A0ABP9D9L8_9BACT
MNEILFKGIKVVSPSSSFNGQHVNLLIKDGVIAAITQEEVAAEHSIEASHLSVSEGWFDLRTKLTDPGFEHKDTIASISASAVAGGFTDIAVLPNTKPALQTKESVVYVKDMSRFLPVDFHVLAALTKDCKGEEMTEMTDLHHAGAVAFTDGVNSNWHMGVLKRALLYAQGFDGCIIDQPEEQTMTENGHMNEGISSTLMGTRGIPTLAEEIAVQRSLAILAYTGGRLHLTNISSAKSVDLIKEAKAEGLQVTCDVSAAHLFFTDEDLASFDTNLKVKPPFRGQTDRQRLWEGIQEGVIDAISSNHVPQDEESKNLEFDLADFGMLGLETAFAAIMSRKPEEVSTATVIEKLTTGPRGILKQEATSIEEGAEAILTIFSEEEEWTVTREDIKSYSDNTAFVGKTLKGKPVGIINKGSVVLNVE